MMTSNTQCLDLSLDNEKQRVGLKRSIELNQGLIDHLLELQSRLKVCRVTIKSNADLLKRRRKRRLLSADTALCVTA
ncbi:hypothetical protein SAMN02745127_01959 [Oceanospirillum multiglobuliferum]|uniref:Uncharacterized protein n=1 Tax=Oceanospirillum multiglobuliferum TaxID=64969 RepID=A0A1T4QNU8_9GAMM|nr:hypothetical protein [Oceanospirillum multiglobuliferum]OPX56460.1 hypothetical protein BTE48_03265 [Oceanospirillum multiglobuliferum]SKA05366.1 hypothetical protein SAMN02745127_01959 [Oceanospirillum multiglobuliferum]